MFYIFVSEWEDELHYNNTYHYSDKVYSLFLYDNNSEKEIFTISRVIATLEV